MNKYQERIANTSCPLKDNLQVHNSRKKYSNINFNYYYKLIYMKIIVEEEK